MLTREDKEMKEASRELERRYPAVQAELTAIEKAKQVTHETLRMEFMPCQQD